MIRIWEIGKTISKEVSLNDESSLDAITRQLPDGYYSTFRTYENCTRVIGLSSHLKRLPNLDVSLLRRQLTRLLEHFRHPSGPGVRRGETTDEARVRVILTFRGQLYIAIESLAPLPKKTYEKGVHVATTFIQRNTPRVKSTVFIDQSDKERRKIAQKGIFEALLVKNGRILEGMTSNFFYVIDGVLFTAQRDILLGVTRRTVIRVARGEGIGIRYASLKLDQLPALSEAFITSSSRGIVPVVQIDEVEVGQGSVGEVTKHLSLGYGKYVKRRAEKI